MSVRTDESYETGELSYVVVEGLWGWLNADMLSCIEGVRQGGRGDLIAGASFREVAIEQLRFLVSLFLSALSNVHESNQ